jgi:hypothetical protein
MLFQRNLLGNLLVSYVMPLFYPDSADRATVLFMSQQLWDMVDPLVLSGYKGPHKKRVLVQSTTGDAQVSPVALWSLMRSMDASLLDGLKSAVGLTYRDELHRGWLGPGTITRMFSRSAEDGIDNYTGLPIRPIQHVSQVNQNKHDFGFRNLD